MAFDELKSLVGGASDDTAPVNRSNPQSLRESERFFPNYSNEKDEPDLSDAELKELLKHLSVEQIQAYLQKSGES